MGRDRLKLGMVVGAVVIAAGLSVRPAAACTLSLGWEPFAPFQMADGGRVTGLDVDLFRAVAETIGCTVTPREIPWRRLLANLETGSADAAMGATKTPEREAFAQFSDAYRADEFVLFVRAGEIGRFGSDGLASMEANRLSLGVVGGYNYGETFTSLMTSRRFQRLVQTASGSDLNLRKLLAGRIDAFLENRFVGAALARAEGAGDRVESHPAVVSADDVHFMFSRASVAPEVVASFDRMLETMRADGRYDQVVGRYLN